MSDSGSCEISGRGAGNLVEEFLLPKLGAAERMRQAGHWRCWNLLPIGEAAKEILPVWWLQPPGLTGWRRADRYETKLLLAASDETWRNLAKADWMEAFRSHPEWRIGR